MRSCEIPRCEAHPAGVDPGPEVAREILEALRGLRFGSVEITVHDCRVVQIERREKVRFS